MLEWTLYFYIPYLNHKFLTNENNLMKLHHLYIITSR